MDYDCVPGPDGLKVRVPTDEGYRTCAECGNDCLPEATVVEGHGVRIAFICPNHGVHSVIDPFEHER